MLSRRSLLAASLGSLGLGIFKPLSPAAASPAVPGERELDERERKDRLRRRFTASRHGKPVSSKLTAYSDGEIAGEIRYENGGCFVSTVQREDPPHLLGEFVAEFQRLSLRYLRSKSFEIVQTPMPNAFRSA